MHTVDGLVRGLQRRKRKRSRGIIVRYVALLYAGNLVDEIHKKEKICLGKFFDVRGTTRRLKETLNFVVVIIFKSIQQLEQSVSRFEKSRVINFTARDQWHVEFKGSR